MNKRLFRRTVTMIVGIFLVVALGVFAAKYFTSMGDGLYQTDPDDHDQFVNVMILGVDADELRTDTIMVAQYDKSSKAIKIVQIPRDTKIDTKRADKKINSAFVQGKEKELYDAVYDIFGIKVDKYVMINTKAFRAIVDEVGGVKFDVPINMNYDDPTQDLHIHLKAGEQVLDGDKAEQLVRFRHNNDGSGYPGQDLDRMKTQREFLQVLAGKALSIGNVAKIPSYYGIFKENVKTNLSAKQVTSLMTEFLGLSTENIQFFEAPAEAKYIGGVSYVIIDEDEAHALAAEHFNTGLGSAKATASPDKKSK